ncbi:MAG: Mobile element protein [Hydrogenibacillus schlegelii]|uniref:Mobile element protein n=1 Tax=Hydrogenibacillus schlegelii TaxID=1484 RepID=A0A2T5GDG9_HYDSH|nr:transposase [Hydrogenibacillus schlegelii]PTQ54198.1 MAG: Mobile element protein [Hydrogenibacillus schlegelii]
MQTITLRLRLHRPTQAKIRRYRELVERTTAFANNLVAAGRPKGLTSRTAREYLAGDLPSAVINQALRDVAAHRDVQKFRVLWPSFNNQNLRLKKVGDFWTAAFPTQAGRVRVPLSVTAKQEAMLSRLGRDVKQGAAKLYEKRGRWYLALSVTLPVEEKAAGPVPGKVAGIDMGLRYLAVVNCEGETLFFHGNQAAYIRRRYHAFRKRMGKAKALKAIRQMKDKEARWMKDQDHKISRAIVDWCLARGVSTIRMEKLEGIRRRNTRKRDFGRSLHSWSFYRLQQFIAYKARLAGIRVEWVNPKDTSRTCPRCGHCAKENRNGIRFRCRKCGYEAHVDVVGAWNVSLAISGLAEAA